MKILIEIFIKSYSSLVDCARFFKKIKRLVWTMA